MTARPDATLTSAAGRGAPRADRVSARSLESLALVLGASGFVVGGLAAVSVFRLSATPIAGPGSIGQFAALASAVVALVCVGAGRYLLSQRAHERLRLLDHLDIAALAIACAVVGMLGWTLLAAILAEAFVGAHVFPVAVVILGGAAAAVTAYASFWSSAEMDTRRLAMLLATFFVVGVLAATLSTSDPDWWKDNLSALGVTTNASARAFNLTLVFSGFLITSLARSATKLTREDMSGQVRVRICLVILGVLLALVGVFPVDLFWLIHVAVSLGMLIAFGVLIAGLPRWMPGLARPFLTLGWVFLALLVMAGVFYAVGYYTLTAVELIGGALIFTWVVLFIRNTAALEEDAS